MTTIELKLRAENETEDRIMDYLLENASDALAEKINAGNKTLAGALRYCKDKAQKQAHNGVACIDDATVFGWVIHYFEEAEPDEEEDEKPKTVRVPDGLEARPATPVKPARRSRTPRKEKLAAETPAPAPAPAEVQAEASAPAPENPPPQPAAQPDLFTEKGGQ